MREQHHIIGRDPSCDIVVADDSVSRKHAELIVTEKGVFLLIDRDSTNGSFIRRSGNWESVTQEIIEMGDLLRFGNAEISVEDMITSMPKHTPPPPSAPQINLNQPPSQFAQPKKPWQIGDRLVRCQCGAVKRPHEPCSECGV